MQTAVAHVHPRLESLPLSLLELILGAAFPTLSQGPEDVGYAARGLLHIACTHRDLQVAAVAIAISKAATACAAPADAMSLSGSLAVRVGLARCDDANVRGELSAFASLPPFLRLFAIDHCQQLALAPIPRPNWFQDVDAVWRDIRDPNGGYLDESGVWYQVEEEEVAAEEVMRTNREGVAQFELPCCCCYTNLHGILKELPATVAGFATAPVLFALLQRPGRYASYCVHTNGNAHMYPRYLEHEDIKLWRLPGSGVEPKPVGTISLYSDVPVWYGEEEMPGGDQPTPLSIDVTLSKLGEKLLHCSGWRDDPYRSELELELEQKWSELELKLLCPGVLIQCEGDGDEDGENLVFRTAPGDVYLKGGGNFSSWLLRFIPDEEGPDEASLAGGESVSEEEDEESGEDEEDEEDAVVVEDKEAS